ncbi:MAG: hypothetical protein LBN39_13635 [Planctomycetaceae bacterium]|jgi:hypothetical protein|nr:hypothetical protein [Planctomycetaceae bacterium]
MVFRLTLPFSLFLLSAVFLFSPFGNVPLCAQEGNRNIFQKKDSNTPGKPRPKADQSKKQVLQTMMSEEFSPTFGDTRTYLLVFGFLLIVALFIIAVYNIDARYRDMFKPGYENPPALFREVCAAHQLTLSERHFLKRFAEEADLDNPLPLFIEPQHFLSALQDARFDASKEMLWYFLVKLFDIHRNDVGVNSSGETEIMNSR